MADYKTMYHVLFAATEDVLALLEKYMASAEELAVPMRIQAILENAQQKCAPRSQIIYKFGQRKSKIPIDKRKKRAILQSRSKKGKVKNDLWKGGRQAWVFPISSPGLSSRSWRRPAARWSFSAAIWHSDSTACPVRSTMSCPPAFPPSTATLWSRGGAAVATSASRGCRWIARRF